MSGDESNIFCYILGGSFLQCVSVRIQMQRSLSSWAARSQYSKQIGVTDANDVESDSESPHQIILCLISPKQPEPLYKE